MGKLTLNIMAAFADFEREIIREQMEIGRKAAEKTNGDTCMRTVNESIMKCEV
jgi:DNA invertase Pin-like site-specific DNA recombinase